MAYVSPGSHFSSMVRCLLPLKQLSVLIVVAWNLTVDKRALINSGSSMRSLQDG